MNSHSLTTIIAIIKTDLPYSKSVQINIHHSLCQIALSFHVDMGLVRLAIDELLRFRLTAPDFALVVPRQQ